MGVVILHTLDGRTLVYHVHDDLCVQTAGVVEVEIRGERHKVREPWDEVKKLIREA